MLTEATVGTTESMDSIGPLDTAVDMMIHSIAHMVSDLVSTELILSGGELL